MEPNPIDFDKVLVEFQQFSETGNIAVIVVIAVILSCYVTVLVIVRKFDEEDQCECRARFCLGLFF